MNPGETSLPRAERRASTGPVYGPPAWRIRSSSTTTLPRSWSSCPAPLCATTQPPSMSVLIGDGLYAGGRGPRGLGEPEADGRVGLERAPEPELLADVPERGQDLLAEEADAGLRVLARDEPVGRPRPGERRQRPPYRA